MIILCHAQSLIEFRIAGSFEYCAETNFQQKIQRHRKVHQGSYVQFGFEYACRPIYMSKHYFFFFFFLLNITT